MNERTLRDIEVQLSKIASTSHADAYDRIIDALGAENIQAFVPMWERDGLFHDLLRPNLRLRGKNITGYTLAALHTLPRLARGSDSLIEEVPLTENVVGDQTTFMNSGVTRVAQRLPRLSARIGKARMNIRRIGDLPGATVKLTVRATTGGLPGGIVANGESNVVAANLWGTNISWFGFSFETPPTIGNDADFWLCLEYQDATGVDGGNYIQVYRDPNNSYGQPSAAFSGSWASQTNDNLMFDLYTDDFHFSEAFGVIVSGTPDSVGTADNIMFSAPAQYQTQSLQLGWGAGQNGGWRWRVRTDLGQRNVFAKRPLDANQQVVLGASFDSAASADKMRLYVGHRLEASLAGNAGEVRPLVNQPVTLGAFRGISAGSGQAAWSGLLGPFIVTSIVPSPAQMAKVAHLLRSRRG